MPEYTTVFQISSGSYGVPFALSGLIFFVIGAILAAAKWRFRWRRLHWLFIAFSCAFGILWMFLASAPVLTEGVDAFNAFQTGHYALVEGEVTDFHPMPYQGHQDECFSVQDERFCYSDYEATPGFRNSASHGGPIRAGIHVRIAYLGGTILRLQIQKSEVISPQEAAIAEQSANQQYGSLSQNDRTSNVSRPHLKSLS